jgi:alkanesulfonate monooxygenase SsuD/methylene tetrahydromethanopterin reductase-like flavin-dependent oxidoreductase (luciferase family)
MRIGILLLPEVDWPADLERWRRVEDYGFDHAWLLDHLAWRSLADATWFATMPTLAAAALSTSNLRLGTLVTSPNFRHPVTLAKELMTLDVMSGGRLTVGIGGGAPGYDASVLGQPALTPRQSSARLREFVTLLDLLLRQPQTTWHGDWFTAVEARTIPGPAQRPRPPFVLAANGPKGIELAVTQAEGWVTLGSLRPGASGDEWWSVVEQSTARFDAVVARVGAPAKDFPRYLDMAARINGCTSIEHFRDDVGRAVELGFTDVVTAWPRPESRYAADERLLDQIASELGSMRHEFG